MMENTVPKRKDVCNMDCDSATLKKARHSWQVKRTNREDISSVTDVVICDNISSCLHCNSRGTNSLCGCNQRTTNDQTSKYLEDKSVKDMDCSVAVYSRQELLTQNNLNENTSFDKLDTVTNVSLFQIPPTPSSSVPEGCSSIHNLSRTSSPASSSINFSFDGQDVNSDLQKEDGRTSASTFSNATSIMAQPSSIDPEIEEEGLLISHRQREEELNLYLKRWQNQHIAKSIVDNAINKTLEEMGVSPEPQQFVSNLVENHAISEAIKLQGLIPQSQCNPTNPVAVLSDLAHSSSYFLSISNQHRSESFKEQRNNHSEAGPSADRNDLLDHAVSVAIGSKGLKFHEPGT